MLLRMVSRKSSVPRILLHQHSKGFRNRFYLDCRSRPATKLFRPKPSPRNQGGIYRPLKQMVNMSTYHDPTADDAIELFKDIEAKFPHATVGKDQWYLVAATGLVYVEPKLVGVLYTYLLTKPEYSTSESRKALVRRIREALVKSISILGVPKPIEAIFAIVKVEQPEDQDFSFSREHWKSGPENHRRGEDWLNTVYGSNLSTATDKFTAHRDFDYISRDITYGFYLSDHSILGPIETELVVLTGMVLQNLEIAGWHLRGTRRVGVSKEDVELIHQCIDLIGNFGGLRLNRVPRVADIEHEV